MGKLILMILVVSNVVFAEETTGSKWVTDWWEKDYKNIQQKEEKKAKKISTCDKKLLTYKDKTTKYPTNKYYLWRYNSWKRQCTEEKIQSLSLPEK